MSQECNDHNSESEKSVGKSPFYFYSINLKALKKHIKQLQYMNYLYLDSNKQIMKNKKKKVIT